MTSRVSSKNKEKKGQRKNSVKKRDQTEKKWYKEQKTASPGQSNPVYLHVQADHCTTVTHMI